ncbi:hypothetical protein [Streptosporangium sp. NPDC001681]|uniref:hypothetical protein n=1 Tax=Streptosporangium sp. NPDC001681 TaxID=3154395 RepID=UPI003326747B
MSGTISTDQKLRQQCCLKTAVPEPAEQPVAVLSVEEHEAEAQIAEDLHGDRRRAGAPAAEERLVSGSTCAQQSERWPW